MALTKKEALAVAEEIFEPQEMAEVRQIIQEFEYPIFGIRRGEDGALRIGSVGNLANTLPGHNLKVRL